MATKEDVAFVIGNIDYRDTMFESSDLEGGFRSMRRHEDIVAVSATIGR